jgi:hypothetical protein
MSTPIDPDLVGIWIVPGQPQTYEVTSDGAYHVADPEEPLAFEQGGTVMIWGARRHTRLDGAGETPVGRWTEDASGDDWVFAADGSYAITAGGATDTGIWALRDAGSSLWTRETRAQITSDGAHLTFRTGPSDEFRYGYTVADGIWRLLDPETWAELTRYVSAAKLAEMADGEVADG